MSRRNAALIAGWGYVAIFIFGVFANFFVFEKLVIAEDPAGTVENIRSSMGLFRAGIAVWILTLAIDVIIAWALHLLLKPLSPNLSQLAMIFRVVYVAVFGASLTNLTAVIAILQPVTAGSDASLITEQVSILLNQYQYGFLLGLAFFGIHLLLVGSIFLRSEAISTLTGYALIVAAPTYIIDTFAHILMPNYSDYSQMFLMMVAIPAIIAEFALLFWLLAKGGREPSGYQERT